MKTNSIWLSGEEKYIAANAIAGNKCLFIRDKSMDTYRAVLDYKNQKYIPVLLDEDQIKNNLKQLKYLNY